MLKKLMEQRGALTKELDILKETLEKESRTKFSDEEKASLASIKEKISAIDADIENFKDLEEQRSKSVNVPNYGAADNNQAKDEEALGKASFGKMVRSLAKGEKLDGLELEVAQEGEKEMRNKGFQKDVIHGNLYMPIAALNGLQKRTMQVATTTKGGNFVPTEKLGFFDALYAQLVASELGVTLLTGLEANTDLIGLTAGATAGWDTENAAVSASDATTGVVSPRPKRAYSAMDVSALLQIQSNESIDSLMLGSMQKSLGVLFETAMINGDGTNKPTGILGTSGIQSVAMGTNGGAPTLAKLLELVQKVLDANTTNPKDLKWLINPKTMSKLKQTVIDSGSGAMIMAYNEYFGGVQGIIDNRPAIVSTLVPSNLTKGTASGVCSAILFGDFSQVYLAQYGALELSVDRNSAAMARQGATALTINMYIDSVVRQPACLGAIQDATTT